MLGSLFDDLKLKVEGALRLAVAGAIAAGAAMAAFVCFAVVLFLWMQQTYGTLEAWLALAILFAVIAAAGLTALLVSRRRRRLFLDRPQPHQASATARLLQDPAVLLAGLQAVRFLGVRGLLPLLIVGVVAGGMMMNRNGHAHRDPPAAGRTAR